MNNESKDSGARVVTPFQKFPDRFSSFVTKDFSPRVTDVQHPTTIEREEDQDEVNEEPEVNNGIPGITDTDETPEFPNSKPPKSLKADVDSDTA